MGEYFEDKLRYWKASVKTGIPCTNQNGSIEFVRFFRKTRSRTRFKVVATYIGEIWSHDVSMSSAKGKRNKNLQFKTPVMKSNKDEKHYLQGKYYLKNFEINSTNLPALTPVGDYRVDFTISKKEKNIFIKIYRMLWYTTVF